MNLSRAVAAIDMLTKANLTDFVEVETAINKETMVAHDGSLLTVIRIRGARSVINDARVRNIAESLTNAVASFMEQPGHALDCCFVSDNDRAVDNITSILGPGIHAARVLNMNISDITSERIRHLAKYITWEEAYIGLWTTPQLLTKIERKQAAEAFARNAKDFPTSPEAQSLFRANENLIPQHESFVGAVVNAFTEQTIMVSTLNRDEAMRVGYRAATLEDETTLNPVFPEDHILSRISDDAGDASPLLWPKMSEQVFRSENVERIDTTVVRINNRIFGNIDMLLGPTRVEPFQGLINRIRQDGGRTPWRIRFLFEGGAIASKSMQYLFAKFLAWSNGSNGRLFEAMKGLKLLADENVSMVKMRVSLGTWAPANNRDLLDRRLAVVRRSFEAWGQCQASSMTPDDPLEGFVSSFAGLHRRSTASSNIAPTFDAMTMLPFTRPASAWQKGTVLFRSPDGKAVAYEPGSNRQNTWIDLFVAPPGSGKSVLLNTVNLACVLSLRAISGNAKPKLPRIAIIDIGPSSSGLISVVRGALPASRQHEALYVRLRNTREFAVNPFDTQLGCRYPLSEERDFLVNLISIIVTPENLEFPYDGIRDLLGFVVDEVYKICDPDTRQGRPKQYEPGIDEEVDASIAKHGLTLKNRACWWDIVDAFMERSLYREAGLAQRYAVPTLDDCILAAREERISDMFTQIKVPTSESLIDSFSRYINSAVKEYKVIAYPTRFDVAGARIVSLDLADVIPPTGNHPKQTSIMYMLARNAVARDFYLHHGSLKDIDPRWLPYHKERIRDLMENPKRLSIDELHRASNSVPFMYQLDLDGRTSRKSGVQLALISQQIVDFPEGVRRLATSVFICGAGDETDVRNIESSLGLSPAARRVVERSLNGPNSSGAPFLAYLRMKDGTYEQYLYNTLGPIELWAFSTSAKDAELRHRLYDCLGPIRARQRLAALFPTGTAEEELEKRTQSMIESGFAKDNASESVMDAIVGEIVNCKGIAAHLRGVANMESDDVTFYDWSKALPEDVRGTPQNILMDMYEEGFEARKVTIEKVQARAAPKRPVNRPHASLMQAAD